MGILLKSICTLMVLALLMGAGPRTQNFVVDAADPVFAGRVAEAAEAYRRSIALEWLGRELPPWQRPCPIRVVFEPQAHGATSFRFNGPNGEYGQPFDWQMEVYGTPERILDSVLPHEIAHTIFASHFQQRLPRWLDEGACSSVEHVSETRKQEHNLLVFLTTGRGIPFNQMFQMMDYPRDMLPLYSQGYSVVRFLLELDSKPHFVNFVRQGLQTRDWDGAVERYYGFNNLSDLQVTWNKWVGEGSPKLVVANESKSQYVPRLRQQHAPLEESELGTRRLGQSISLVAAENFLFSPAASQGEALKSGPTTRVLASASWEDDPYFSRSRSIVNDGGVTSTSEANSRRRSNAQDGVTGTVFR